MRLSRLSALLLLPLLVVACGSDDDPTSSSGSGTARFTTWGEEYIEDKIGPDPEGESGFVDGWTLKYDKFLVVFHGITVADQSGKVGASLSGSKLVDNTKPGKKDLVSFTGLEARAWDRVSYQIKPADANTEIVTGDASDKDLMVKNGYSIYVAGSASKTDAAGKAIKKTFAWGFKTATQYNECHSEEDGKETAGIIVKNGGSDVSELTTHGDHFFYDRLSASPDPAIKTRLRFDEKAKADDAPNGDGNGEITLDELSKLPIDVKTYDPSGINAPTLGAFMESLARTVGHFRGEGECTISKLLWSRCRLYRDQRARPAPPARSWPRVTPIDCWGAAPWPRRSQRSSESSPRRDPPPPRTSSAGSPSASRPGSGLAWFQATFVRRSDADARLRHLAAGAPVLHRLQYAQ